MQIESEKYLRSLFKKKKIHRDCPTSSGHGKRGTPCWTCQNGGGKLGCLDLVSSQLDYQDVEILPHSTVYCDIPYKDTAGYDKSKCGGFDHDRFYAWADSREYPVFISEYAMPSEFTPIACTVRIGTMNKNNNHEVREEKIFVQERFAEQYRTNLFL